MTRAERGRIEGARAWPLHTGMYLAFLAGVSPAASISALAALHSALAADAGITKDLCSPDYPRSDTHPSCAERIASLRNWTVANDTSLLHLEGAAVDVADLSLVPVLPPHLLPWPLKARAARRALRAARLPALESVR